MGPQTPHGLCSNRTLVILTMQYLIYLIGWMQWANTPTTLLGRGSKSKALVHLTLFNYNDSPKHYPQIEESTSLLCLVMLWRWTWFLKWLSIYNSSRYVCDNEWTCYIIEDLTTLPRVSKVGTFYLNPLELFPSCIWHMYIVLYMLGHMTMDDELKVNPIWVGVFIVA